MGSTARMGSEMTRSARGNITERKRVPTMRAATWPQRRAAAGESAASEDLKSFKIKCFGGPLTKKMSTSTKHKPGN